MPEDPGSTNSLRFASSGVGKIGLIGYDTNFETIRICIPPNVTSRNLYP